MVVGSKKCLLKIPYAPSYWRQGQPKLCGSLLLGETALTPISMQKDLRAGAMTPQPAGKVQHSKAGPYWLHGSSGQLAESQTPKQANRSWTRFSSFLVWVPANGWRILLMRRRAGEGNQPGRLPERRLHRNGEIARKGVHLHHRRKTRSMCDPSNRMPSVLLSIRPPSYSFVPLTLFSFRSEVEPIFCIPPACLGNVFCRHR